MSFSSNTCLIGSFKGINTSDTESSSKSSTKLPSLMKNKIQEHSDVKENMKQTFTGVSLGRRTSDDLGIPSFKKFRTKKKIIEKKKKFAVTSELEEKFNTFKIFLNLVNLSNNIEVSNDHQKKYVLYVGKGNNSPLIKSIFRTYRPWWTIQETDSNSEYINLHWYQLRQNSILQNMKELKKTDQDFENCHFQVEGKLQNKQSKSQSEWQASSKQQKSSSTLRSHSVTTKQLKSLNQTMKRTPSRFGSSQKTTSPLKYNLKKQIRQDFAEDDKKKKLANPKMWPIYHNYRKLFNNLQMKGLKKLNVIGEDGKPTCQLSRNKLKHFENKSRHIVAHNKLSNNWNLSNKKALFMNLRGYYQCRGENPFDHIPMTFHIKQHGDKEFQGFIEEYNRRQEQIKEQQKSRKIGNAAKHTFKPKRRNAWLVKPGENTNRGNGIEVVETLEQIQAIIQTDTMDKKGQSRTHIIQQYITPFLYNKRKFDIRTYILLTSVNGGLKGYWYQDGYIRTSCKQFNMKNLTNKFIHLTNDAVQKYHQDYGKYEPGNKLSYSDFQRYLDSQSQGNKLKLWNQACPQMKKLATDAIRATFTKFDKNKKEFSFEIFGLDFLIDENFKVWLIQANTNPCLQISCPLLGRIIPPMLENAFKIVVDPIFPPPDIEQIVNLTKKVTIPDNIIESNKFQLIFDQAEQGKELKLLLKDTPQIKIYDIQQDEDDEFQDIE